MIRWARLVDRTLVLSFAGKKILETRLLDDKALAQLNRLLREKEYMPGSGQVWNMVSEADAEEKKIDDLNAAIEYVGGF